MKKVIFFILTGLTFFPAQSMEPAKPGVKTSTVTSEKMLSTLKNFQERNLNNPTFISTLDDISRIRMALLQYVLSPNITLEILDSIKKLNIALLNKIYPIEDKFIEQLTKLLQESEKNKLEYTKVGEQVLDPIVAKQLKEHNERKHIKEVTELTAAYNEEFIKIEQEHNSIIKLSDLIEQQFMNLKAIGVKKEPISRLSTNKEKEMSTPTGKALTEKEVERAKRPAPTIPKSIAIPKLEQKTNKSHMEYGTIESGPKTKTELIIKTEEKPSHGPKKVDGLLERRTIEVGPRGTKKIFTPLVPSFEQKIEKPVNLPVNKLESKLKKQARGTEREISPKELNGLEKLKMTSLRGRLEARQAETLNEKEAEAIEKMLEKPDRELISLTHGQIEKMINPEYRIPGFIPSTFKPGIQEEKEASLEKSGADLRNLFNLAKQSFAKLKPSFKLEDEVYRKKRK